MERRTKHVCVLPYNKADSDQLCSLQEHERRGAVKIRMSSYQHHRKTTVIYISVNSKIVTRTSIWLRQLYVEPVGIRGLWANQVWSVCYLVYNICIFLWQHYVTNTSLTLPVLSFQIKSPVSVDRNPSLSKRLVVKQELLRCWCSDYIVHMVPHI